MGADYLEYCIRDQQQDEMLDYLKGNYRLSATSLF